MVHVYVHKAKFGEINLLNVFLIVVLIKFGTTIRINVDAD